MNNMVQAVLSVAETVYGVLEFGYPESVYEKAMAHEMRSLDPPIDFTVEAHVEILYKGIAVGMQRLDFIVNGVLAVELKTGSKIAPSHRAQTTTYLRTTNFPYGGLIICFTPTGVQHEAIASPLP